MPLYSTIYNLCSCTSKTITKTLFFYNYDQETSLVINFVCKICTAKIFVLETDKNAFVQLVFLQYMSMTVILFLYTCESYATFIHAPFQLCKRSKDCFLGPSIKVLIEIRVTFAKLRFRDHQNQHLACKIAKKTKILNQYVLC